MKLRPILTACVMALAAIGMTGASAASAATEVPNGQCAGQATATINNGQGGLGLVGLFPSRPSTFVIVVNCIGGGQLKASGNLTGTCGLSTGTGILNDNPSLAFNLQTNGTVLELTPRNGSLVVGAGNAVADPNSSGSCANGTATRFLVTGAVSW